MTESVTGGQVADHSQCDAKIKVLTSRLKRLTDWHNKEVALGKTVQ